MTLLEFFIWRVNKGWMSRERAIKRLAELLSIKMVTRKSLCEPTEEELSSYADIAKHYDASMDLREMIGKIIFIYEKSGA